MRTDTGDTGHTHRGTSTGALQSYVSSHTPGEDPRTTAHTRQLRQEQETRGEKTSPEPHRFPGPWFGTHTGCGSAVAGVSGAVQEKWDHQHLEVGFGSGDKPGFSGEHALLSVFPPSTTAGAMLSPVSEDVPAPQGPVQRSCLLPAAPDQHQGSIAASAPHLCTRG